MKIKILIICLLAAGAGCASSLTKEIESVSAQYATIAFEDGIGLKEAKLIAQQELIKQKLVDIYDLSLPQIARNVSTLPNYHNYWFISFKERKPDSIEFIFMCIIDKKNGRVKFSNDYPPSKQWILEAALLG